jgi:hypothetical protein
VLVRTADKNPLHFLQLLTLALGGHLHSSLEIVTTSPVSTLSGQFEKRSGLFSIAAQNGTFCSHYLEGIEV